MTDLASKRVLLLGAETGLGRDSAAALSDAGARLALIGASNDAETAFTVQRLARKLKAEVSQAIDATNDMAVRVMVRQVAKALGGLDAVVLDTDVGGGAESILRRCSEREFARQSTAGIFVSVGADASVDEVVASLAGSGT